MLSVVSSVAVASPLRGALIVLGDKEESPAA